MAKLTFGHFLTAKRLEKEITLRGFAAMLGLSPVYICNVEKGKKSAPSAEILKKIAVLLQLNKEETADMYDLAARTKNAPTVSGDLPEYIMEKGIVRQALRRAKEVDATDEDWQYFIERITPFNEYNDG